ncbi:hypothetical protein [Streptomyces sp. NPDC050704]|uniref:hypothetical protein n=1 Tax=Streptomyces sp. NPDC050704 TaxID=3157219 RepID=UPI00341E9A12
MSEPTKLTREQLLPLAVAAERRNIAFTDGQCTLLPPLPDCPICGQPSTALRVQPDYSFQFDLVRFAIKPCGHSFTADGEDVFESYNHARQIVASGDTPNSKENEA